MFFIACKVDDSVNPELIGVWENLNQRYTFREDYTYSLENLRPGNAQDSIIADSLWGTYELDNDRSNLSLKPAGYRLKSTGELVNQALNDQTWNYQIAGNTLNYTSQTTIGKLEKVE